jgi:galactokinase
MNIAISPVKISELYRKDYIRQQIRLRTAMRVFDDSFPGESFDLVFSTPGLTELCGNRASGGKILAAAVNLDTIALVKMTDNNRISIYSKHAKPDFIDLTNLEPDVEHFGQYAEIVRGIAAGFLKEGLKIGGFTAYIETNIPKESGLGALASFEITIANIFSQLYNSSAVPEMTLAKIADEAEKNYFGYRDDGLFSKIVAAIGGVNTADFTDARNPITKPVDFDLNALGYTLCVTKTIEDRNIFAGANSFIPHELKAVAELLNVDSLSHTTKESVMTRMSFIRKMNGDRAFLRTMHFYDENERVTAAAEALKDGDTQKFLRIIKQSGDSSYRYLQNIFPPENPFAQSTAIGLYLSDNLLGGEGFSKVAGCSFTGCIQAFVPKDMTEKYITGMDAVFGLSSCRKLEFRSHGSVRIEYP